VNGQQQHRDAVCRRKAADTVRYHAAGPAREAGNGLALPDSTPASRATPRGTIRQFLHVPLRRAPTDTTGDMRR
jgi:hypothetical protein